MKNVLIIGANGQIARLVEEKLVSKDDIHLTLFLRNASRLSELSGNHSVTIIDGDANDTADLRKAIKGQDIVYVSFVDHGDNAKVTKDIIKIMDEEGVKRLISSNILGIYNEVPGEFGRWNHEQVRWGLAAAISSNEAIEKSDLDYTVLRIPWLNDRDEVKYSVTHKGEEYVGVSASRKSVADLIIKIIEAPSLYKDDNIGFADPATEGSSRPVY